MFKHKRQSVRLLSASVLVMLSLAGLSKPAVAAVTSASAPVSVPPYVNWQFAFPGHPDWSAERLGHLTGPSSDPMAVVGDLNGDGRDEMVIGSDPGQAPTVTIFGNDRSVTNQFAVYGPGMRQGVNVAVGDVDGDGLEEIVVAPSGTSPEPVLVFDRFGLLKDVISISDVPASGGWLTAMTGKRIILTMPVYRGSAGRTFAPKYVSVDISEQRLRAYEYGQEVKSFLVSTGTLKYPTPLGKFSVLAKLPEVLYQWTYGPNNPDNYDLGLTPWNLRIMPHIYIHYAPWHNNFGRRVSHGCINVNLENIKWIYGWAEVGIPVDVIE